MVQRVQVVALAISVAIGAAVVTGLTLGSREAPVHVGPTTLPALDLVDVYATILVNLAGPASSPSPRTISVSRTIYDTCVPGSPKNLPAPCGRTKVGKLKPDIEAALHEALAAQGFDARFGDEGDLSLHQVVTEATGTPAADGDVGHSNRMKFHFKRVGGRLQLQGTSPE
ncbi:MAG TPA: hypothetical protein VIN75_11505 [Burkholderiaceae bacterium]